ncbi:MAG: aromatic ring-hydroxylating dioxygenase subunit alpha [Pseudomonadota bacterium]
MDSKDLQALIEPSRIHRHVYVDDDIFQLEMEKIWGFAWIYVGHTSQIPKAGDFITTDIGLDPVIMVRDDKDQVNVLYNRCAHKGAKVTGRACGQAKSFRCPYHGWMYGNNGELRGLPARAGYDNSNVKIADPKFSLQSLAQVDDIRGFVFATKSQNAPDLRSFLGETALTLENIADRAPEGAIRCDGGRLRYRHPCNWKMFVENLNDAMHPMIAHGSVGVAAKKYMKSQPEGTPYPKEAEILFPFGSSYDVFDQMGMTALPNGHGYMGGEKSIHTDYSEIPGYWDAMLDAYGEERTRKILSSNRHNTIFYPSFTAKDAIQAIRVVRPRSVNETVVETYHFRLLGAPEEMFERTILYSRLINSSAGMVGPDDLDCYQRMQQSLQSNASDWVDVSRYLGAETQLGDAMKTVGTSDLTFRNQYTAWLEYMTRNAA